MNLLWCTCTGSIYYIRAWYWFYRRACFISCSSICCNRWDVTGWTSERRSGYNGFLQGGVRCSQNEDRLFQEKAQRNLLKKYLTQATGDPIQSSLISSTIPGKGALDDFDVGLGTKSSIISKLAGSLGPQAFSSQNNNILGSIGSLASSNNGLLNSLVGGNNNNTGLLSSLVSLASTPNNNGNILSSLGGLGTGLLGGNSSGGSGLLGSIQSGINTLNTLNKVNNAVSGIKGIFA